MARSDRRPIPFGLSPYQHTFVGRENELAQLRAAVDAATDGIGVVVALLGEPGIGKTALCQQVIDYAVGRGFRTIVGHCYEGGTRSQPHLPILEALQPLVVELK